jgi:hypothetical protein
MAFIQPPATEALADARHCTQPGGGVGVMLFGGVDNRSLQAGEPLGVVIEPREVDRDALLPGRIGTALGHALPVGRVGEFFADRGEDWRLGF